MSQHCPVCKTRLWTDPLFTPARLHCPRCGAEFKPTVPWSYFRVLLVIVVALALLVITLLTRGNLWLFLFLMGLLACLWLLPRIINLQHIGPELTPSEGVFDPDQLEFKVEDVNLEEAYEEREERQRFRRLVFLLVGIGVLFLLAILLR